MTSRRKMHSERAQVLEHKPRTSTEISTERCASLRATSFVIQSSSLVYASDHFGFTELPSQREIRTANFLHHRAIVA